MFAFNYSKLNKNLHFFVMLSLRQRKSNMVKWRSVDLEKRLGDREQFIEQKRRFA